MFVFTFDLETKRMKIQSLENCHYIEKLLRISTYKDRKETNNNLLLAKQVVCKCVKSASKIAFLYDYK
jgi:hypothetical protein